MIYQHQCIMNHYYESCDILLGISKQTENINRLVLLGDKAKDKIIAYVPHGIK